MKFLPIGLLLFLGACMPRYSNVPVEDAVAGEAVEAVETIDLDTAEVTVDEDLTKVSETTDKDRIKLAETTSKIPNSDLNASATDKGTNNSRAEMVKPLEVASVESKPANSLLAQANSAISAGNHAKAEALLERALRITPRDPKLWYKMSQVKYAKGDYRQASAMAMRSNTMSSNTGIKKQNWRIIADSREKLGDLAGADQARRYATQ